MARRSSLCLRSVFETAKPLFVARGRLKTVGDVPIDRLDGALVEAYKSKRLAAKGTAPATINKGSKLEFNELSLDFAC